MIADEANAYESAPASGDEPKGVDCILVLPHRSLRPGMNRGRALPPPRCSEHPRLPGDSRSPAEVAGGGSHCVRPAEPDEARSLGLIVAPLGVRPRTGAAGAGGGVTPGSRG